MTLTDQDRRDRIDATAGILTDLGLPTLAARLRDVIDELLPPTTPARTPGQIAYEAGSVARHGGLGNWSRKTPHEKNSYEAAAQAVIAHHEQQPVWWGERIKTTPAPAPAPSWSPVVGGWAEHSRYGRVLVLDHDPSNGFEQWLVFRQRPSGEFERVWVEGDALSAPVPRVWESAEDVPAHVVAVDKVGSVLSGYSIQQGRARSPFTEVLPVGGVW